MATEIVTTRKPIEIRRRSPEEVAEWRAKNHDSRVQQRINELNSSDPTTRKEVADDLAHFAKCEANGEVNSSTATNALAAMNTPSRSRKFYVVVTVIVLVVVSALVIAGGALVNATD